MSPRPEPNEPVGKFNYEGGWSATEQIAFRQLQYAEKETFEFIAEHKNEIINMTFDEAVEKGWVKKSPRDFFGWVRVRAMAQVFDAFIAMGED